MIVEPISGNVRQSHPPEETGVSVVRIDALRCFNDVVTSLGGDPKALLAPAQIEPELLSNRHAVISYRALVHLLERCANELNCPDFGLRLAQAQGGAKVLGPLEIVMNNSSSLIEAFKYCAEHIQAYSPATQISLEAEQGTDRTFLGFEILLAHLPYQRQTVEQALLLTQHAANTISRGQARPSEVWFSHEPIAPVAIYRAHFNTIVRFDQPASGLFFRSADLSQPIADPDPQLYEVASTFIDARFPSPSITMTTRVRSIISKQLIAGQCSSGSVASTLGLHPRTLQRRLREEGECFESIKDSVRRDIALRYLRQPKVPLVRVAEMLGYSETSVLARSCDRWFSSTPSELRNQLVQSQAA